MRILAAISMAVALALLSLGSADARILVKGTVTVSIKLEGTSARQIEYIAIKDGNVIRRYGPNDCGGGVCTFAFTAKKGPARLLLILRSTGGNFPALISLDGLVVGSGPTQIERVPQLTAGGPSTVIQRTLLFQ